MGQDLVVPSLGENAVIGAIDVALVTLLYFSYRWAFIDTFGLVMLIEAAVFMLIGGAMEFSTSASGRAFVSFVFRKAVTLTPDDIRRSTMRAATFTLVGVLLFAESLLLALIY